VAIELFGKNKKIINDYDSKIEEMYNSSSILQNQYNDLLQEIQAKEIDNKQLMDEINLLKNSNLQNTNDTIIQ
jgi:hypothetical protein